MASKSQRLGSCYGCGQQVDPKRSCARIAEGRIVNVCESCSSTQLLPSLRPREPQPREVRDSTPAPIAAELRRRRLPAQRWSTVVAAVAAAAAMALAFGVPRQPAMKMPTVRVEIPQERIISLDEPSWAMLDLRPQRRDDQWVHPVAAAFEVVPKTHGRRFGAERPGNRPSECGLGHCGLDLGGPRGTPIVAVLPGVVLRVEFSSERRSGRYVAIEHDDGSRTSYMHLDRISPDLNKGQRVMAGHMLGTLGKTGIHHSDPHLHFSLEVPQDKHLLYVDPTALLEDSVIIDVTDIELPSSAAGHLFLVEQLARAVHAVAPQ